MGTVSVRDLRERLSYWLDCAAKGETVTVTRHGAATARLVPVEPSARRLPPLGDFRDAIRSPEAPLSAAVLEDRDECPT